ncbi:MAG: hypothetical protein ACREO8_04690 [Luteimonas sp.]
MSRQPAGKDGRAASSQRRPRLLRRCALGLWLCGIAVIGALEFQRAAFSDAGFRLDLLAWLWLTGAIVVGAIGIVLLLRELRRSR